MASDWLREHTHRIMFPGRIRYTPSSAFQRYLDWRRQSSTCEVAYRRWTSASSRDCGTAFAAYTAALDREEQAAAQYEAAVSGG